MNRLTFKREFVDAVREGRKRFTSRWKPVRGVRVGQVVAAVCRTETRPAHLVPAADAFCRLLVVSHETIRWADFTDADAARCGVTRDWYLRERPDAEPTDTIHVYGFLVAGKSGADSSQGVTGEGLGA